MTTGKRVRRDDEPTSPQHEALVALEVAPFRRAAVAPSYSSSVETWTSGEARAPISVLRGLVRRGWAVYATPDEIRITPAGRAARARFPESPTPEA